MNLPDDDVMFREFEIYTYEDTIKSQENWVGQSAESGVIYKNPSPSGNGPSNAMYCCVFREGVDEKQSFFDVISNKYDHKGGIYRPIGESQSIKNYTGNESDLFTGAFLAQHIIVYQKLQKLLSSLKAQNSTSPSLRQGIQDEYADSNFDNISFSKSTNFNITPLQVANTETETTMKIIYKYYN